MKMDLAHWHATQLRRFIIWVTKPKNMKQYMNEHMTVTSIGMISAVTAKLSFVPPVIHSPLIITDRSAASMSTERRATMYIPMLWVVIIICNKAR